MLGYDDYFHDPLANVEDDWAQFHATQVSPQATLSALQPFTPGLMTEPERVESDRQLDSFTGVQMRTQEEAQAEAERQGRVTWGETLGGLADPRRYIPYAGAYFEDPEQTRLGYDVMRAKGIIPFAQEMTDPERQDLLRRLDDKQFQDAVTHYRRQEHTSTLANIGQGALDTLAGMTRYGLEIAGARKAMGLVSRNLAARTAAQAQGKLAPLVQQMSRDAGALSPAAQRQLPQVALNQLMETDRSIRLAGWTGQVLGTSIARGAVAAPAAALQRAEPTLDELIIKDGTLVDFSSPEAERGLTYALFRGFAAEFIETAVEHVGDPIDTYVRGKAKLLMKNPAIRDALKKVPGASLYDAFSKLPMVRSMSQSMEKLRKASVKHMQINSMPAEYGEERLQMFARAFLNLDRGMEDKPLEARLLNAARFEVDNPVDAASMALGFLLFPMARRAAGAVKGAASPASIEANQGLYKQMQQMFYTLDGQKQMTDTTFPQIRDDPHLNSWWQNVWNATVDRVGKRDAKVTPHLRATQPPTGSLGYFFQEATGVRNYKDLQKRWKEMSFTADGKANPEGEAKAKEEFRMVLKRRIGYNIVRATTDVEMPADLQMTPEDYMNFEAMDRLSSVGPAETEAKVKELNVMVEKGMVRFSEVDRSGFMSRRGPKGDFERTAMILDSALSRITDAKMKHFIQSHTTEVRRHGEAAASPMLTIPTSDWKDTSRRSAWVRVLSRISRQEVGGEAMVTLFGRMDAMVKADPQLAHIQFAPSTLAQLQSGIQKVQVRGLQADVKGEDILITADARGPTATEEFFHAVSRRRGRAVAAFTQLQNTLKDLDITQFPDSVGKVLGAVRGVKDISKDVQGRMRAEEFMAKLAVIATGSHRGEVTWTAGTEAMAMQQVYDVLSTTTEGRQALQQIFDAFIGKEVYQKMLTSNVLDVYAEDALAKDPVAARVLEKIVADQVKVAEKAKAFDLDAKFPKADLSFDAETHTYTVKGAELPAATELIGTHKDFLFDPVAQSLEMAEGDAKLAAEFRETWVHIQEDGTALHKTLEQALTADTEPESADMRTLRDQLRARGTVISERQVWTNAYAGTVDIIVQRPDGSLELYDLKTTPKDPFRDRFYDRHSTKVPSSKKDKHRVQLQAYRNALEKQGAVVSGEYIIPMSREGKLYQGLKGEFLINATPTEHSRKLFTEIFDNLPVPKAQAPVSKEATEKSMEGLAALMSLADREAENYFDESGAELMSIVTEDQFERAQVSDQGNRHTEMRDADARANAVIKNALRAVGMEGQDQQLPHIIAFGKEPGFREIRNLEQFKAYFDKPSPYPAGSAMDLLFNKLKERKESLTNRDFITIESMSRNVIIEAKQLYRDDKGGIDTQSRALNARVANLDRDVQSRVPVAVDGVLSGLSGSGATDGLQHMNKLTKAYRELTKGFLGINTNKEGSVDAIANWLTLMTNIPQNAWKSIGVAEHGIHKGQHRLRAIARLLQTGIGMTKKAPEGTITNYLAKQDAAQKANPNVDISGETRTKLEGMLMDLFTSQPKVVQENARIAALAEGVSKPDLQYQRAMGVQHTILSTLSKYGDLGPEGFPARVRFPTGRAKPMVYSPTPAIQSLQNAGMKVWEFLGLSSQKPYVHMDSSDVQADDVYNYMRQDFDLHYKDPKAMTYGQWIGPTADKSKFFFVDSPIYRTDTPEGRAVALAAFKEYESAYNKAASHETARLVGVKKALEHILVKPSLVREAIEKNSNPLLVNHAMNQGKAMGIVHGDVGQYESVQNMVKRSGPLVTPGQEPTLNIDGGVGEMTTAIVIADPMLDANYGPDAAGNPQVGQAEGSDGMVLGSKDWMRKYRVSTLGDLDGAPDGYDTTKSLYVGADTQGRLTQFKCALFGEACATALDDSYHTLVWNAAREKGLNVDQIIFGSTAKVKGLVGKPIGDLLKKVGGKWTMARDFNAKDVVSLESKNWRWLSDTTHDVGKHQDALPKQLLEAWSTIPGAEAAVGIVAEMQRRQIARMQEMLDKSPLKVYEELGESVYKHIPDFQSILDGTRQPTALEQMELGVHIARWMSKKVRPGWPTFGSTVNVASGGSDKLKTSRRVRFDPATGDYVEDEKGDRVRVARAIINVDNACGPDEITPGYFTETGRVPGRTLGTHAKAPVKNDLFYARKTKAEALYALALAFTAETGNADSLGRLRPDLFRADQVEVQKVNAAHARLEEIETKRTDMTVVDSVVSEFLQVEEFFFTKKEDQYQIHIPGEIGLYERVPTGGPDTLGICRLAGFIPDARNVTILPQEDWTRTGSDFDADKWYNMHMAWGETGKTPEGKDANRVLAILNNAFKNPETLHRFMTPVNAKAYEDIAEAPVTDVPLNHPGNTELDRQLGGKQSLTTSASVAKTFALMDQFGIFVKGDAKIDFSRVSKKFQVDYGQEARQPSENRSREAAYQQDVSIVLNAAADNSKLEGLLKRLGVDKDTMTVLFLALRGDPRSVDQEGIQAVRKDIIKLVKTPEFQKYLDQLRYAQSFNGMVARTRRPSPEKIKAKEEFKQLFLWARDVSSLSKFLNAQYEAPESAFEYQNLVDISKAIRENRMEYLDTSGFIGADKKLIPRLRASAHIIDLLGEYVYTPDSPLMAGRSLIEAKERSNQTTNASERRRALSRVKFEITQNLVRSALRMRNPNLASSTSVASLADWQRAHRDNDFLSSLEIGRRPATHKDATDEYVRLRDSVKVLEMEDPRRQDLRTAWDALPSDIQDQLFHYTNEDPGPTWHNKQEGWYNFIGPQYLQSFDENMKAAIVALSDLTALEAAPAEAPVAVAEALTDVERRLWEQYRKGEFDFPEGESPVDVAREQRKIYRGLNPDADTATIRKNPDGSLTLLPQVNMDGQTVGVSATPYKVVAWDYATRDYARGTSKHVRDRGDILTLTADASLLADAKAESDEELVFPRQVTIPAGKWSLGTVAKFPQTVTAPPAKAAFDAVFDKFFEVGKTRMAREVDAQFQKARAEVPRSEMSDSELRDALFETVSAREDVASEIDDGGTADAMNRLVALLRDDPEPRSRQFGDYLVQRWGDGWAPKGGFGAPGLSLVQMESRILPRLASAIRQGLVAPAEAPVTKAEAPVTKAEAPVAQDLERAAATVTVDAPDYSVVTTTVGETVSESGRFWSDISSSWGAAPGTPYHVRGTILDLALRAKVPATQVLALAQRTGSVLRKKMSAAWSPEQTTTAGLAGVSQRSFLRALDQLQALTPGDLVLTPAEQRIVDNQTARKVVDALRETGVVVTRTPEFDRPLADARFRPILGPHSALIQGLLGSGEAEVTGFEFKADLAHLDVIQIPEQHRKSGIGSGLVALWEAAAEAAGLSEVMVTATRDAVPFWKRLGYVSDRVDADGATMTKQLSPVQFAKPVEPKPEAPVTKAEAPKPEAPVTKPVEPERVADVVSQEVRDVETVTQDAEITEAAVKEVLAKSTDPVLKRVDKLENMTPETWNRLHAELFSKGKQYQDVEVAVSKMPGLSDALHRVFLDQIKKRMGKDGAIYHQAQEILQALGHQPSRPDSEASKMANKMAEVITILADYKEDLSKLTLKEVQDNAELYVWTQVAPRMVDSGQKDKDGNPVMVQAMEVTSRDHDTGLPLEFHPLSNPVDAVPVSRVIEQYEAAMKRNKKLKPWQEVATTHREALRRMVAEADPRLEIEYREHYAIRKWNPYQKQKLTPNDIDTAFLAEFRVKYPDFDPKKTVDPQQRRLYVNGRAQARKRTWDRQDRMSGQTFADDVPASSSQFPITLASDHSKERKFWKFADGAKYGYTPQSLNAAFLMQQWQVNTGAAELNRTFLSALAVSLETAFDPGAREGLSSRQMPQSVMLMDPAMRDAKVQPIDSESAFEHVQNFLNLVQTYPGMPDAIKDYKVDRNRNPWDQMSEIFREGSMEERMAELGFRDAELPVGRLGFSKVWVQDGAPFKLLQHLASRGYRDLAERPGVWGHIGEFLLKVNRFNNFTKQLQLGMSAFFHFAQMESYLAGLGSGSLLNPAKWPVIRRGWKEARQKLRDGAAMEWTKAGVELAVKSLDPDSREDTMLKALRSFEGVAGKFALTKNIEAKTMGMLRQLHQMNNHFLWDVLQPTCKIQIADGLLAEAMLQMPMVKEADLRRDIANLVNDMFGGQNFAEYLWATPMVRDIMRSTWFAPDWTISAINVARLNEMLGSVLQTKLPLAKPTATKFPQQFLLERYWPTFIYMLLLGIPNVLQHLVWMFNQKSDEPDPNMQPYTVLNERDRKAHIDVTPLMRPLFRKMGREFPPDRRIFIRYGKQAYELQRWFTNPLQGALTKGSTVVRASWEQMTGQSTMGWDMPWTRNADYAASSSFGETRAAALGRYFMPMTLTGYFDGRPVTPFTSASLGMSQSAATREMRAAFTAYAENSFWGHIQNSTSRVRRMEDLVPDIVDGLMRNGYGPNVKRIMTGALSSVAARYNREIAWELQQNPDNPDEKKLAAVMMKLQRLNKTYENLSNSLSISMGPARRTYTAEQRMVQREAVAKGWRRAMDERPRD